MYARVAIAKHAIADRLANVKSKIGSKPAKAPEPIRKGTNGLIHTLKVAVKGRGKRRLESAARVAENLRRSYVAAGHGVKAARIAEHVAKIRRLATA